MGTAETAERGQPLAAALLERERKQGDCGVGGKQGGKSGFFFSSCFGVGGTGRWELPVT